jgi:hypothetical protein
MASIVPSERLGRELQDLIAGAGEEPDPIEAIRPPRAQPILQQAPTTAPPTPRRWR